MEPEETRPQLDESARVRSELLNEAKADLEEWARRRFWYVAFGIAAIALIGPAALVETVMTPRIQHEEDRVFTLYSKSVDEFDGRSRALEDKLMDAVTEAKSQIETIKRIGEQGREAQAVVQKLIDQTSAMQKNVNEALNQIDNMKEQFATAHQSFVQTMAEIAPLTTEEIAQIRIKAIPTPTGTKNDRGFEIVRLTYAIESPNDSKARILNAIEHVIYSLDPNWFGNTQIDRRDPTDGFSYAINVWGPTKVTAKLFVRGAAEPLVFEGFGNTSSDSYLDRKEKPSP
jgi:hypothetical protein